LTGYGREEVLGQDFNFLMARAPIPTHSRVSRPLSPVRPRAVQKSSTDARTAATSGRRFSSVRLRTKTGISCSISRPLWT
jgi:hypothetical protein